MRPLVVTSRFHGSNRLADAHINHDMNPRHVPQGLRRRRREALGQRGGEHTPARLYGVSPWHGWCLSVGLHEWGSNIGGRRRKVGA